MKWILRLFIFIIVAVLIVIAVGLELPSHSTHTRSITLQQPPEKVFAALADVQAMAKWNRNTERIEMIAPIDGKERTRQTFKGGMVMVVSTTESVPPHRLVRTLGDSHAPFLGSWTYDISPESNGSRVTLTEQSDIRNPFYRLMVRIFGPTKYIDEHLEDLGKHFDETVTVR